MIEQFSYLTKEEQALLMEAPVFIILLIADSDKDLDQKELNQGLNLMKWKKFHARPDLLEYYRTISENFAQRVDEALQKLPKNRQERMLVIEEQLSRLNRVWPKFDKEFAEQLYASYRELAKGVAEGAGGFLGYLSVSQEEAKLIELPMIDDPRSYNV